MHKIQTKDVAYSVMKSMKKGLHIGTSGWSYKDDWKEVFYHSVSSMMQQYFSYFDTAEINSSFYSLPSRKVIDSLRDNLPVGKFFTAKFPRAITHDNRLDIVGEGGVAMEEFFDRMKPVQHLIEALLIQLPPWDIGSMGDLETFLVSLDSSFKYAIEFRHESWLSSKTWSLLEKYNIAHCIVDEPKLTVDIRVTADFSYIRWHGHGKEIWYKYLYSLEELSNWIPNILEIQNHTDTIFGYFNNHFFGYAPFYALQMLKLLNLIKPSQDKKLARMAKVLSRQQTTLDSF